MTIGSIEIGKLADFISLSADPCALAPTTLSSLEVEIRIIDGEAVHEKSLGEAL
jgi:predicted amidohydrolase YtcJ